MIKDRFRKLVSPFDKQLLILLFGSILLYIVFWWFEQKCFCSFPLWLRIIASDSSDKIASYGVLLQTMIALSIFIAEAFLSRNKGGLFGATLLHATRTRIILFLSITTLVLSAIHPVKLFLVVQSIVLGALLIYAFYITIRILQKKSFLYESMEKYLINLFSTNAKDFKKNVAAFSDISKHFEVNSSTQYLGKSLPEYKITNSPGYITNVKKNNILEFANRLENLLVTSRHTNKDIDELLNSHDRKFGFISGYIGIRISLNEEGQDFENTPVPVYVMDYNLSKIIGGDPQLKNSVLRLLKSYQDKFFIVSKYKVEKEQSEDLEIFKDYIIEEIRNDNEEAVERLIQIFRNLVNHIVETYLEVHKDNKKELQEETPLFYEYFGWLDSFFMTINREAFKNDNEGIVLSANYLPFIIASRSGQLLNLYRFSLGYVFRIHQQMDFIDDSSDRTEWLAQSHLPSNLYNHAFYSFGDDESEESDVTVTQIKLSVVLQQYINILIISLKRKDEKFFKHIFKERTLLVTDLQQKRANQSWRQEGGVDVDLLPGVILESQADLFSIFTILVNKVNYKDALGLKYIEVFNQYFLSFETKVLIDLINQAQRRDSLRTLWGDINLEDQYAYTKSGVRSSWGSEENVLAAIFASLIKQKNTAVNFIESLKKELESLSYDDLWRMKNILQYSPSSDTSPKGVKEIHEEYLKTLPSDSEINEAKLYLGELVERKEKEIIVSTKISQNKVDKMRNSFEAISAVDNGIFDYFNEHVSKKTEKKNSLQKKKLNTH